MRTKKKQIHLPTFFVGKSTASTKITAFAASVSKITALAASAGKTKTSAQPVDGKIGGQGKEQDSASFLLFGSNENFADVFNHAVFKGEKTILPSDLLTDEGRETAFLRMKQGTRTTITQYRDIVRKLRKDQVFAILAIENQNRESYQMPFRVMEMDYLNYARQIRVITDRHKLEYEKKHSGKSVGTGVSLSGGEYLDHFYRGDRLIPCVTLVIYWGDEPWEGPRQLSDMFAASEWNRYAPDYRMHLLDIHRMSDSELAEFGDELRVVFGFVKYARKKERLQNFIEENRDAFSNVSETAVDAIMDLAHSSELERIKLTNHVKNERGNYNMCQALREWMEDSREEGREEGREQGREEGRNEERKATEFERQRADAAERRADIAEQRTHKLEQELLELKMSLGLA
ncbi:MAG: Rpn family recombination-promoting nuclease/putative transposase [Lachnospiraceae bacterium]|nr:Rpn family recombination-promoting nuclease/putative transposase [Lachnospiraceae bacterium]